MKKIEAIVAPSTLDEIRDALVNLGIDGMSVCDTKSLRPRARAAWYRGSQYVVWFAPQYKLEVVVSDDQVPDCVDAIRRSIRTTGDEGEDGTITVLPVDDTIRVRKGDHLARAA
jgi:nitrogen regulatory protein P-II 1